MTGIQRLTLNCVVGLHSVVGSDNLRVIIFDSASNGFKAMRAEYLLGTDKTKLSDSELTRESPVFGPDDQILLTEWIFSDRISKAHFDLTSRVEAKVIQFVHDCIPLACPEFFRKYLVEDFRRTMGLAIAQADLVLTNSDYSKHDIQKFFGNELAGGKEVRVVKLSHEFMAYKNSGSVVEHSEVRPSSKIPTDLAERPFVLMVGTLEERKNTELALRLWRRLQKKYGAAAPVLVLVGSFGWHKLGLLASVIAGRFFSKSIYHLQNCDDETLTALYTRCQFTIYLSKYEGWGLPVGESLWMGKPVLCSNLTSLPEAGEDLVDYVDPQDSDVTFTAIEKLCFDSAYREARAGRIKRDNLRSISTFAQTLFEVVSS